MLLIDYIEVVFMKSVQIVHVLQDGSIVQDMKQATVSTEHISLPVKRALYEIIVDEHLM